MNGLLLLYSTISLFLKTFLLLKYETETLSHDSCHHHLMLLQTYLDYSLSSLASHDAHANSAGNGMFQLW